MNPALLLIADSRLPAGGHAHSGGVERAVASGAVHDVPSLSRFLRGRLHTAGALAAALTSAAALQASCTPISPAPDTTEAGTRDVTEAPPATEGGAEGGDDRESPWVRLDDEVDARTAAPAQREASRTQGRLLLRVARRVWPSSVLDELARTVPDPHHPIALGVAAHAAGATPEEAALAAAYHAISGPATAAVRLLGLDPVAVHALLAAFTPDLTAVAAQAHFAATSAYPAPHLAPRWEALPAYSAPALDLLAEQHAQAEIRLFVS
ncbi:urease accessory protein UreF [Nonomuraea turkmeniaca]|uniref:Urease accessory protein UreF n=1 Tax=Nonomuraea turkmeniaca TaxID=103838 RepID=A0A5S4F3X8_9ACTN|nr:urease accessory UreF family protein [Nonomuraea turkmeniaca]TMR10842.1 urease accessory protein UreF [Nonomuraea turkmeniaca]